MKKILSILLSMLLVLSLVPCAMANSDVAVTLDGEKIEFDVAPQIINDRTMVPLRAIFEALGATVNWDEAARKVTSTKGDKTIELTIDSDTMYVNGEAVTLDSPATIVDSRTLVPIRAISESFGLKVDWVDATRTVVILTNTLEVTKESSHKYLRTVHPGDTVTYTFTVKNGTDEAKQFDITDKVPTNTTYTSGDAVVEGDKLTFSVNVASGETKTFSYTVTVVDDLEKRGTAIVSDSAEYLGNKIICHNIPIRPGRNLAIICESAAVNHRQKKMGYNAAQELYARVQNSLTKGRDQDDE